MFVYYAGWLKRKENLWNIVSSYMVLFRRSLENVRLLCWCFVHPMESEAVDLCGTVIQSYDCRRWFTKLALGITYSNILHLKFMISTSLRKIFNGTEHCGDSLNCLSVLGKMRELNRQVRTCGVEAIPVPSIFSKAVQPSFTFGRVTHQSHDSEVEVIGVFMGFTDKWLYTWPRDLPILRLRSRCNRWLHSDPRRGDYTPSQVT